LFCFVFLERGGGGAGLYFCILFFLAEKSVLCTTDYANYFEYLYLFILQVQPNSPSLLCNTVLELYLHDIVHEKDISVRYIIYLYTNTLEGSIVY
jgi:hypothetical protein